MSHTRDPETEFNDPRQLVESTSLTATEKLKILESWQMDLIELQKAEEENMSNGSTDTGSTAKKLAEVMEAIVHLRQQAGDVKGGDHPVPVNKPWSRKED